MAPSDMVSIDPAILPVLSDLRSIYSLKEEPKTTLKAFLDGKDVFNRFDLPSGSAGHVVSLI